MEKSKESILKAMIQGTQGRQVRDLGSVGLVSVSVEGDCFMNRKRIVFDAFEGYGEHYRRRKDTKIMITESDDVLFCGTFDELKQLIKKASD